MTMPLIEPGTKAPAFALKDQAGKSHRLADYAGQPIVLYFYPKDDTPGCTKEACAFRDQLPRFRTNKAVVLGVMVVRADFNPRSGVSDPVTDPLVDA